LKPSTPWPLTLTPEQREALRIAADLMLPADDHSPSGAALNLDAFIDEWVSAPYPDQQRDRWLILSGLAWLDAESNARFHHAWAAASDSERRAVFDDIAFKGKVKPGYGRPGFFFQRLRGLMLGGFYSRPEGMKDIGYIGNTPMQSYPGPQRRSADPSQHRPGPDGHQAGGVTALLPLPSAGQGERFCKELKFKGKNGTSGLQGLVTAWRLRNRRPQS